MGRRTGFQSPSAFMSNSIQFAETTCFFLVTSSKLLADPHCLAGMYSRALESLYGQWRQPIVSQEEVQPGGHADLRLVNNVVMCQHCQAHARPEVHVHPKLVKKKHNVFLEAIISFGSTAKMVTDTLVPQRLNHKTWLWVFFVHILSKASQQLLDRFPPNPHGEISHKTHHSVSAAKEKKKKKVDPRAQVILEFTAPRSAEFTSNKVFWRWKASAVC